MSSTTADAAIKNFALRLLRARRDSGELSYRELARRMKFRGSPSTLQRAFAGIKLPAWPLVETLLLSGFGVDSEIVRSEWLPLWVAVKDAVDPLEESDANPSTVALSEVPPSVLSWRRKRA